MENVTKYSFIEQERPVLKAEVKGKAGYPALNGMIYFYDLPNGVYIQGEVDGLPKSDEFAFHVHEGVVCENHGDKILIMPNLLSDAKGKASAQIYLDKLRSTQIAGRPIVLHLKAADGTENEIACGLLSRIL